MGISLTRRRREREEREMLQFSGSPFGTRYFRSLCLCGQGLPRGALEKSSRVREMCEQAAQCNAAHHEHQSSLHTHTSPPQHFSALLCLHNLSGCRRAQCPPMVFLLCCCVSFNIVEREEFSFRTFSVALQSKLRLTPWSDTVTRGSSE